VWTHTLGPEDITLRFGGNTLSGSSVAVTLDGRDIIRLYRDGQSGRWLLTGSFQDVRGQTSLYFQNDEVRVFSGSWDVRFEGTRLTVNAGPGDIVAQISFHAADRTVSVERLKMSSNGCRFDGDAEQIEINTPTVRSLILSGNMIASASGATISIASGSIRIG
jgi:hypothetical protein